MGLFIFIYGLILGSFYNVVGIRVPKHQSIASPGSACSNCGHRLSPIELIPVLSYFFQRGKCSKCKKGISPVYPIFELLTGLFFILAFYRIGWNSELIIALSLISLLVIISVSDFAYFIIPDQVLLIFTGIFVVERFFFPLSPWWDSFSGAAAGFLLLFFIQSVSKGGMGGGDVKLFGLLGFVVGLKVVLLSFLIATFYGAFFGILGILLKKLQRKQPIPFGPFIGLGTLSAYFFGEELINMYLKLFII